MVCVYVFCVCMCACVCVPRMWTIKSFPGDKVCVWRRCVFFCRVLVPCAGVSVALAAGCRPRAFQAARQVHWPISHVVWWRCYAFCWLRCLASSLHQRVDLGATHKPPTPQEYLLRVNFNLPSASAQAPMCTCIGC